MSKDDNPPAPEKKATLRNQAQDSSKKASEKENVPFPSVISHKDIAQLWDVVIRAHYLALELGDPCARSGLAAARMALALSEVLSSWATVFGEELEALEKRSEGEGGT